jgi:hypothetical protein
LTDEGVVEGFGSRETEVLGIIRRHGAGRVDDEPDLAPTAAGAHPPEKVVQDACGRGFLTGNVRGEEVRVCKRGESVHHEQTSYTHGFEDVSAPEWQVGVSISRTRRGLWEWK